MDVSNQYITIRNIEKYIEKMKLSNIIRVTYDLFVHLFIVFIIIILYSLKT